MPPMTVLSNENLKAQKSILNESNVSIRLFQLIGF
jgi:hypothetical protein